MPNGTVVNDYVQFYFSPITAFTYTIYKENVGLVSPNGVELRKANEDDRIFFVCDPFEIARSGGFSCFSNYGLKSRAPIPQIETDINKITEHIFWDCFDEPTLKAAIDEIGYEGVCYMFNDCASPAHRMNRSAKRMAEFLVFECVPLNFVKCIIAKSDEIRDAVQAQMDASQWDIPIYTNPRCYFG